MLQEATARLSAAAAALYASHVAPLSARRDALIDEHLWPHAQRVTLQMPALDAQVHRIAEGVGGLHPSALKYVLGMVAVFVLLVPYLLVLGRVRSAVLRHAYNLLVGVLLAQIVLGPEWLHLLGSALVAWLIMKVAPSKVQHLLVFAWAMAYMSWCHLYMMERNYLFGRLDFSGTQMVLTIKLTSLAYNVYDGSAPGAAVLDKQIAKGDRRAKLFGRCRALQVMRCPSLFVFLAYVFNFTTVLAGPAFEFVPYVDAVERPPDFALLPVFTKFATGLVAIGYHLVVAGMAPASYWHSAAYFAQPLWFRAGYMWVALSALRAKFYFAWKISEAGANAAGYGRVEPETEGQKLTVWERWDGAGTMNIVQFELPTNVQMAVRHWNRRTQSWLELYVYLRNRGNKLNTFFISAIWHGFYPGYYLFFMTYPFILEAETALRRKVHARLYSDKLPAPVRWLYTGVCSIFTILLINYVALSFQTYTLHESILTWWEGFRALPHAALIVIIALLTPVPSAPRGSGKPKEKTG